MKDIVIISIYDGGYGFNVMIDGMVELEIPASEYYGIRLCLIEKEDQK